MEGPLSLLRMYRDHEPAQPPSGHVLSNRVVGVSETSDIALP